MWRVDEDVGPATAIGLAAGCPFCSARMQPRPSENDLVMLVSGHDAGLWGQVAAEDPRFSEMGFVLRTDPLARDDLRSVFSKRELHLPLESLAFPSWIPPFSLDHAYVIESLVHVLCNRCLVGDGFHWKEDEVAFLVAGLWEGKFDLRPEEVSELAIAHGMPVQFQCRLERLYSFGRTCLTAARRRFPVKKWRRPTAISDVILDALRHSYHWHDA